MWPDCKKCGGNKNLLFSLNILPITGLDKRLLGAAFYLQAAVFGKDYYDFGLLRPVGQDLGGFIYEAIRNLDIHTYQLMDTIQDRFFYIYSF
jgi:hypothetical protein